MTAEILINARLREKLRFIPLQEFFHVLEISSPNSAADLFELLEFLREKGLKLTPAPSGCIGYDWPIYPGEVSIALAKVKKGYWDVAGGESDDADLQAWKTKVLVAEGTPDEHKIELGQLYVDEANYAEICRQLGAVSYEWPKIHWPRSSKDLATYSTANGEIEEKNEAIPKQPTSQKSDGTIPSVPNAIPDDLVDISAQPSNVFERRCKRLRQWLCEKQIPEDKWNPLLGWKLKDIYHELINFSEFWTPGQVRIGYSTFKWQFWKKQRFCKLPDNKGDKG